MCVVANLPVDEDNEFNADKMINAALGIGNSIDDEFGTEPERRERAMVPYKPNLGVEHNAEDDYEEVRHNLRQLIADSDSGIPGLLAVAKESESPRAYEVVSTYLKTAMELNMELINLHKTRAEIETEQSKAKTGGGNITNNNVFVGTTEDLQKYLEERK